MIPLGRNGLSTCEGLTRREWLRLGGLGSAGLLLPELLRARAAGSPAVPGQDGSFGRARSCILLFLFGAPAHQDLWDLKPQAPREVRGEFKPIASTVPGIQVGEGLPRTACQAHRLAIVRSVSHPDDTHTVAMHFMLTGVRHLRPSTNPQNQPDDFPTFGAVLRHLRRDPRRLPAGISLNAPANQVSAANHIFPGFFAGWLGSAADPMFIPQDPSKPDFRPLPLADEDAARRLAAAVGCWTSWTASAGRSSASQVRTFDTYHDLAFQLVTSRQARQAFDLSRESSRLRDRYGWSAFGQGCLLARRLVEAGVPLITVNWARDDAFWDTHSNNFNLLRNSLLPPFDLGFSALLDDLAARGLLDETLVVVLGEFGRTPRINRAAGRDHWAACNSVVLAGGGIRGGQIHGASDKIAAYPATPPVSPAELAATIYHALGVDPHTELRDPLNRPTTLCTGQPLTGLFR